VGSGFFIQKWLDGNHEKTIPLILASSFLYSVTPAMAASGNMTIEQRLAALEKDLSETKKELQRYKDEEKNKQAVYFAQASSAPASAAANTAKRPRLLHPQLCWFRQRQRRALNRLKLTMFHLYR
jgi:hypothetical protein